MSSIQKPKYFMGLQHWEGQSPQAVFANVLMIPRGLALFHMPSALCMRPNLQSAAPTENCPVNPFLAMILPKPSSAHAYFISYSCSSLFLSVCLRLYFDMVTFFLPMYSGGPSRLLSMTVFLHI